MSVTSVIPAPIEPQREDALARQEQEFVRSRGEEPALLSERRKNQFDELSPRKRIIWLMRNDQPKFVVFVLAVGIFVYLVYTLIFVFLAKLLYDTAVAAQADDASRTAAPPLMVYSGWFALTAVILGAGIYMWAKGTGKKSEQGYNLVQAIVTAAVGYIAGKHS